MENKLKMEENKNSTRNSIKKFHKKIPLKNSIKKFRLNFLRNKIL
jgi:hypothetical protein